ncbi:MAG: hypothetical protein Q8K36_06345 [Alphaproteobacteria bacterium]|nr:hypothetical protein [Alphaproteobacteria bacterium]
MGYAYLAFIALIMVGCTQQESVSLTQCLHYQAQNMAPQADQCFQRYILQHPKDLKAFEGYITFLRKQNALDRAQEVIHQARKAIGENPAIQFLHAKILMDQQKFVDAEKILIDLSQQNPNDHAILNCLGIVYDLKNDHAKAQSFYRQAIQLAPKQSLYQSNMGLSLIQSGEFRKARTYLEPIKHEVCAQNNLAIVYAQLNMRGQFNALLKDNYDKSECQHLFHHLKSYSVS